MFPPLCLLTTWCSRAVDRSASQPPTCAAPHDPGARVAGARYRQLHAHGEAGDDGETGLSWPVLTNFVPSSTRSAVSVIVGQFMLYFASKVSSRDPARGSDSPVSRPFMMMTRKEMPLRYPHEHEVAMKPAPGRRDSDPGDATYPQKAVSREMRAEIWVG